MGRGFKYDSKLTTNYCFSLDIHWLKKNGYIQKKCIVSGTLSMRFRNSGRTFQSLIESKEKAVRLVYKHAGEKLSYSIPLTYSECNYGGKRPWFVCPNKNCSKRVGVLFLRGKYFLCRHCHNLAYETQNMSEQFRLLEKAQNIRERIDGSTSTVERFPSRPKGMHMRTYLKRWHRYDKTLNASWGIAANKWGFDI